MNPTINESRRRAEPLLSLFHELHARKLWEQLVPRVGVVEAWAVNGRVVLLQLYGRKATGPGWEAFVTASPTTKIDATVAAVRRRVAPVEPSPVADVEHLSAAIDALPRDVLANLVHAMFCNLYLADDGQAMDANAPWNGGDICELMASTLHNAGLRVANATAERDDD